MNSMNDLVEKIEELRRQAEERRKNFCKYWKESTGEEFDVENDVIVVNKDFFMKMFELPEPFGNIVEFSGIKFFVNDYIPAGCLYVAKKDIVDEPHFKSQVMGEWFDEPGSN